LAKLIDIRQDEQAAKEAACARYYALLGDREAAVRGLKRAVEQRVFGVLLLRADPVFREFFQDPELGNAIGQLDQKN
jgi:hypothetical protein